MERVGGQCNHLESNGCVTRAKKVTAGRNRRYGEVEQRRTRSSVMAALATRMDSEFSPYGSQPNNSQAADGSTEFMYQLTGPVETFDQFNAESFPNFFQSPQPENHPVGNERDNDIEVKEVDSSQVPPLKGTSQPRTGFYTRMHKYYIDNYDKETTKSANSIQLRWSTISKEVSKFSGIIATIQRMKESGKTDQDRIKDAIKIYQQTEAWQFGHCWEILMYEPKWNDKLLETSTTAKAPFKQALTPSETPTQSAQGESTLPERPEGRDSVKKSRRVATSSSSVAIEMLKKMHDRGEELDEQDSKQKEELMTLERAKFDLMQKQWKAKYDMIQEQNKIQREMSQEQLKLQREMSQQQLKLQRDMMETTKYQSDIQIMFTNLDTVKPPLRDWVAKKQYDILARDAVLASGLAADGVLPSGSAGDGKDSSEA